MNKHIRLCFTSHEGKAGFLVDGVRYVYDGIDKYYINSIEELVHMKVAKHGKALNVAIANCTHWKKDGDADWTKK
jgi:hypothetical protein